MSHGSPALAAPYGRSTRDTSERHGLATSIPSLRVPRLSAPALHMLLALSLAHGSQRTSSHAPSSQRGRGVPPFALMFANGTSLAIDRELFQFLNFDTFTVLACYGFFDFSNCSK